MTHDDFPQTLAKLPPGLLSGVREVLREGESLADFIEAALRQQLAQRQAALRPQAQASSSAGGRHAADELLAQLDAWLKAPPPGPAAPGA